MMKKKKIYKKTRMLVMKIIKIGRRKKKMIIVRI